MKTLVITIIRKPLDGTIAQNCLDHGSGALDIDGSRVGAGSHLPFGRTTSKKLAGDGGLGAGSGRLGHRGGFEPSSKEGRFPANLVLTHLSGCECVGVKRVKGSHDTTGSWGTGPQNVYGKYGPTLPQKYFTDADGKETVENWTCVEGCPVHGLDNQSIKGGMHSAGVVRQKVAGGRYNASSFHIDMPRQMNRFGDTGGASRFFKQFEGVDDG